MDGWINRDVFLPPQHMCRSDVGGYVENFPPLQLSDNSDTNTLRLGVAKADIYMTQRPVVLVDSLSAASVSIYLHLH